MTRTTALLLSLLLAAAPALAQPPILERNAELAAIDARLLGLWHQVDVQDGAPKTVEVSPSHWAVAEDGRLKYRAPVIGQRGDEQVSANRRCARSSSSPAPKSPKTTPRRCATSTATTPVATCAGWWPRSAGSTPAASAPSRRAPPG